MNARETSLMGKPPQSRYKFFVTETARTEEVWALGDKEGWLILDSVDDQNVGVMPVFPQEIFAQVYREKGMLEEYACECIDLNEFMEWMKDLQRQNIQVAVFPHTEPEMPCVVIPAEKLAADFRAQFAREKGEE